MPKMFHKPIVASGREKVMIGTPAFQGISAAYTFSLHESAVLLEQSDIAVELAIFSGDCHVDDARNRIVRDFLESDCEQLIFIDSDLGWQAESLLKLIRYEQDVVAGVYRFKQEEEAYPVAEIESAVPVAGLVEVNAVPTGFLKIRRKVLQQLKEHSITFIPKSDNRSNIPVVFERQVEHERRRGGDYAFCKKWKDQGGRIYLDQEMHFEHYGENSWSGCIAHYKRVLEHGGIGAGVYELRNGLGSEQTYRDMYNEWDNEWAATPNLLMALALIEVQGNILETGCGISSIVLAASHPECQVHCIENDLNYYAELTNLKTLHNLDNLNIHFSEIKNYTEYHWYDIKDIPDLHWDMIFCDGPRKDYGRKGLYDMVKINNAIIVADDANSPRAIDPLIAYSEQHNREVTILGHELRPFAISLSNGG